MFVRTKRLTLRPGWIEDAPELARAIGQECVVRNLSRVPWPYTLGDAETFLADRQRDSDGAFFLIWEHDGGNVRLIGGMGLARDDREAESHELGYWLVPSAWGRGYATEAGLGVVRLARESLRLKRLVARHCLDNPASGRVLRKLGFRLMGQATIHSLARRAEVPCATLELPLAEEDGCGADPHARMAA